MATTPMSEIVYAREEGHVMSDKVSQLASSVYSEFEKMIKKYDEDVVKELMPLVVGILESLDQAYSEKQEVDVEIELLKEDNEQLLTQYEREKQLRKSVDQKYLEMEDETEEYKKQSEEKMESLESIVRMLELKNKNASDHLNRLEEKEAESKKEYNKVHERYTELMRTHMDYMERAKMLMGTDRIAEMANSPRSSIDRGSRKGSYNYCFWKSPQPSPIDMGGFQLPNLRPVGNMHLSGTPLSSTNSPPDASAFDMMSPRSGKDSNVSIRSELSESDTPDINSNTGRHVVVTTETSDKEQNTDAVSVREFATATKTEEDKKDLPASLPDTSESKPVTISSQSESTNTEVKTVDKEKDNESVTVESVPSDQVNKTDIEKDKSCVETNAQTETEKVPNVAECSDATKQVDSKQVTENLTEGTSETAVINNVEKVSEKIVEKKDKTKKLENLEKIKKIDKTERIVPETPQSPVSPVFDPGDFSYEEDVMPGLDETIKHIVATTPELDEMEESMDSSGSMNNNRTPKRNDASIYDELTIQDADLIGDVDYGADITGRAVNPADYASSDSEDEKDERGSNVSDNFFGMSRELENLILENTELLATKNALNIVKDDLIAKVDEMSSEQEILKGEIQSLKAVKDKLQGRIKDLEEELKKTKEELEKKSQQAQEGETEDDVPMAQRKRFTRVEMARVLMERNQYKERLMELQEAVRWTEMIRASREHPEIAQSKKKSSIWNFGESLVITARASLFRFIIQWLLYFIPLMINFFSNLFSSSPDKPKKKPLPVAMVKYNAPTTNVQPVGDPNQKNRGKYNLGDKNKAYDFLQDDLNKSLGEPIVSQPDTSEKAKKEREKERKEQYKQVRAHVKKDDGRMQAYGWSLPAKFQPQIPSAQSRSSVPVPVPVYCRPLLEGELGLKIWCAAGVNLTGGRTKDGGSIVGASVFYSNPPEIEDSKSGNTEVDKLEQQLKDHENNIKKFEKEHLSSFVWICTSSHSQSNASVVDANNPGDILETFRVSTTPILCIASVPGALESDYPVDEDILKAESYPQYPDPVPEDTSKGENKDGVEDAGVGGISFVQCATGGAGKSSTSSPVGSPPGSRDASPGRSNIPEAVSERLSKQEDDVKCRSSSSLNEKRASVDSYIPINKRASLESLFGKRTSRGSIGSVEKDGSLPQSSDVSHFHTGTLDRIAFGETLQPTVFKAKGSPVSSGTATPDTGSGIMSRRILREPSEMVKDGINSLASGSNLQAEEVEKTSSVLPTMWLGAQSGSLYVHSSVSQWRRCLHSVKLRDSILNIVHVKGRVLVALADGTVAIFHRDTDGQWDLQNYHLLDLGKPHHSIRCMSVIANKHVWCGYRNKIHVVDPQSMTITKSFDAHPRKESQVRQLAWVGDGVWVSIRLDSTLRLYHAYTHQHLQDVDIEPYVSKMLGTGKLGFSFVRITSMLISCNRLWIGTGNGVIISVPLSENNKQTVSMGSSGGRPGGLVRVYSDTKTDDVMPASFIPYCTMAQAQLSFHGHRDAVKFFVAVPVLPIELQTTKATGKKRRGISNITTDVDRPEAGEPSTDDGSRLVISGGEGYVDFRIGDGDDDILLGDAEEKEEKSSLSKGDRSHLIVWEVSSPE
ncbi:C-Jun-amino-terminal kinase-interacting protein 4-like isoform X6 [Mercenaria mercenaria]|uniref:C-Jun-amino-terminal kinase-interacting protein 4-like isoform X6 n=1 Tax=Mercenaria mercenaria TaxID=6596 RepID=UPI00234ED167|nr:C-Jun-amino-terminal kinase-interacting protein 4-like isoform X6 [Mercenaria mercenaria]